MPDTFYNHDQIDSLLAEVGGRIDARAKKVPWVYRMERSTRFQSYPDGRYISGMDANFGASDTAATETAGTGAAPLVEWENVGLRIDAGETLVKMKIYGRVNDAVNTPDVELYFYYVTVDNLSRFSAGWDNDNELVSTLLYKDFWHNPINDGTYPAQPSHTGAVNDYRGREYPINFTPSQDGWLTIIADPTRLAASAGNDYFYSRANYYFNPPAS